MAHPYIKETVDRHVRKTPNTLDAVTMVIYSLAICNAVQYRRSNVGRLMAPYYLDYLNFQYFPR